MGHPKDIGDIVNASFTEKIGIVGNLLIWVGWFKFFSWIYNSIHSYFENRDLKEFYEKDLDIEPCNPDLIALQIALGVNDKEDD
jgi:hypothetical protein